MSNDLNPRIAIYPISANPPTWGHADILQRISPLFEQIYWAAAVNPEKKYLFSANDRLQMMRVYVKHFNLHNVTLESFTGSTVRYALNKNSRVLVKGLRNYNDFQAEYQQAVGNRGIDDRIETYCIFGNPGLSVVSSSLVRELAALGEDITGYVHPEVALIIQQILSGNT